MTKIADRILDMTAQADAKLELQRTLICHSCKARQTTVLGSTCGTLLNPVSIRGEETCGCLLPIKWKLLNQHCPRKKW